MKRKSKRMIGFVLAVILCFCMLPTTAFAYVYYGGTISSDVEERDDTILLNADTTIAEGVTFALTLSAYQYIKLNNYTLTNYGTITTAYSSNEFDGGTFYNYGVCEITGFYKVTVYDLTLSSIALSSGTLSPSFAAGTREYAVTVDNSVTSIDITPTLNTGTGVKSMTVNGTTATSGAASTVSLSVGENSIPIVITANDGSDTANTYTLTVTRQSASCSHSSYTNGFCDDCGAYQPATLNGSTYEISNAGQLFWFASLVNGDTTQEGITAAVADANAVLTADIDLDSKEWIPIGNQADSQSLSYRGTFDGGGHTISGLYINNSSSSYQGLFGYLRNGKVQNVTVSGNTMVGGVVGSISNSSTVKYCINSGNVNASQTRVGGIVGNNGGDVTDCYNIGEVSGSNIVGGVVGNNYSGASVSNCYYLTGTATAAIGLDNGMSTSVAAKTSAEFASGEVAYLLNGSVSAGTTWYQNIDCGTADSYPVLDSSHGAVYYGTNCAGTAIYSNSTVPAATHSLTHVETQGATCTETGNNEYWYCSVCGGYFSDAGALGTTSLSEVTIPAKGHSWGATVYTWSADGKSCTATRTCETDSSHVEESTATVTGVETKAATCTEDGETTYTAVFSVSWASEQTKVVADISAKGHNWGATVYTWSDDGKSCTATRTCETDGTHVEEATATVTGVETKAATCTENGETTYTAVFSESWASEQTKVVADISAKGHNWGATVYTWSDDGKSCTATRTCETDSSHVEEATATVTGEETKAATCTEDGETTYTAVFSVSWASEQTKVVADISATGHSWGATVYTWSDDGKSCTATRTCETDSSHVEEATATVTGEQTKAATCTEVGETTYTAVFSESWASEQTKVVADISATGHTWDAGVVTKKATCTAAGVMTYTCTVCGETRTETIAATGHSLTHVEEKEATCEDDGNIEYWYCETCGKYFSNASATQEITWSDIVISPTGHVDGDERQENVVAATDTTDGSYDRVIYCSECGAELVRETITVPATGQSSTAAAESDAPLTGDDQQIALWAGLVILSAGLVLILLARRRDFEQNG